MLNHIGLLGLLESLETPDALGILESLLEVEEPPQALANLMLRASDLVLEGLWEVAWQSAVRRVSDFTRRVHWKTLKRCNEAKNEQEKKLEKEEDNFTETCITMPLDFKNLDQTNPYPGDTMVNSSCGATTLHMPIIPTSRCSGNIIIRQVSSTTDRTRLTSVCRSTQARCRLTNKNVGWTRTRQALARPVEPLACPFGNRVTRNTCTRISLTGKMLEGTYVARRLPNRSFTKIIQDSELEGSSVSDNRDDSSNSNNSSSSN
mmetsp:Transcript_32730/g.70184  ORF Transcript_32730/g.70184 Transcript_32730/m.70184 type:complete len:262 (+) Transcript_32730:813-1598(+)